MSKNDSNKGGHPTRISLSKTNGPDSLLAHPPADFNGSMFNFHPNHFSNDEEFTVMDISTGEHIKDCSYKEKLGDVLTEEPSRLPFAIELSAGPGAVRRTKKDGAIKEKSPRPSDTLFFSASLIKSFFMQSKTSEASQENKKSSADPEESVKNKMMMMWHTMKYGWSSGMKTSFSKENPLYLLGKIYHSNFDYSERESSFSNLEGFKRDFWSIFWFTYRIKFPPLPDSGLTSDCGWGCMLRSGQMIMASALKRHFLPVGWFYEVNGLDAADLIHKGIVKWFLDSPGNDHPFSLHNLIIYGHKINKKSGSWFGPSCVAHMLKEALSKSTYHLPFLERLHVYVAQDGAVYVQDVLDQCDVNKCLCPKSECGKITKNYADGDHSIHMSRTESSKELDLKEGQQLSGGCSLTGSWERLSNSCGGEVGSGCIYDGQISMDSYVEYNSICYSQSKNQQPCGGSEKSCLPVKYSQQNKEQRNSVNCKVCQGWKSCIILIPVRLGRSSVNPIYHNCINSLFLHDLCIGVIGGKPKQSYYFVGFQEDTLIYLDPHLSQDFVGPDYLDANLSSFHCRSPRRLPISKMDPSATIGFYCHTRQQFFRLIEETPLFAVAKDGKLSCPLFEFVDGHNEQVNGWLEEQINKDLHSL